MEERESMREKRAADSPDACFLLAKSIAASCLLAFLHSNASMLHIAVNDDGIHHFAWVMWRCSPPAVGATISFALKYKDSMIRRLVHVRLCVSTVNKFHIYGSKTTGDVLEELACLKSYTALFKKEIMDGAFG